MASFEERLLYQDFGFFLSRWTSVGMAVNPQAGLGPPCYEVVGWAYAYQDLDLGDDRFIHLDVYLLPGNSFVNIFLLTDETGAGQIFRVDGRPGHSCGFASSSGWNTYGEPAGFGPVSVDEWHHVILVVDGPVITGIIDGQFFGAWPYTTNGGVLGLHGGDDTSLGGRFDTIIVAPASVRTTGILANLPSYFDLHDRSKLFWALVRALGRALDDVDAEHFSNHELFRVVTATGEALDKHAVLYGVKRFSGETDKDFRARILASLAQLSGTRSSVEAAVAAFVPRTDFVIFEFGQDSWVLGESQLGHDTIIRAAPMAPFNFEVFVNDSSANEQWPDTTAQDETYVVGDETLVLGEEAARGRVLIETVFNTPATVVISFNVAQLQQAVKAAKMAGTVDTVVVSA